MTAWFEPPLDLLLVAALSALLAWLGRRRGAPAALWLAAPLAAYALVSELIRAVIPSADYAPPPGEPPSATFVLWSNPAFRADLGLALLALVVLGLAAVGVRRLVRWADDRRLDRHGVLLPPSSPAQKRLSAVGAALALTFPLIVWIWAGWTFIVGAGYDELALPLLAFLGVAALAGALWYRLEGLPAKLALLSLIALVVGAQLRFNATRPPGSIFQSNGSVPAYLAILPVLLGVMAAGGLKSALHHGQIVLAAWRLAAVLWIATALGWVVRFLGVYDFQNSYGYDLGALFETPLRVLDLLTDLFYRAVPRAVADELSAVQMARWKTAFAFLGGLLAWLGVAVWLARRRGGFERPARGWWSRAVLRLTLQQRRYLLAYALILPAVALRTFTSFYPFLQTVILSVQKYNPAFPPRRYIAFANFEKLSTDLVVRESLEFTLVFVFVSTFFQITLGLAIAHLLNANFRLRGLARTISLIPWAIPMVVAAIGFKWMFDDQFGVIPDIMQRLFGYEGKWLVNPRNAQIAVIFVNVWKSTPFCALLLLAGLQGVSLDLYEAAKVDGANWVDALRFITVPMLLPIIVTTTMFMLVWQLAVFDLTFAMTGGAPGFSTTLVAQKIYLEINSLNYSFAAAVSIAMVLLVTAIGAAGLFTLRRVEVPA